MSKSDNKEPRVTVFGEDVDHEVKRKVSVDGIIWGLLLIFAGIIFLLNSFEVIPWNVWQDIWKFWPLLLIGAGISIIFGNNEFSSLVVGIIFAIVFSSVLVFILSNSAPDLVEWVPQEVKEVSRFWEVIDK